MHQHRTVETAQWLLASLQLLWIAGALLALLELEWQSPHVILSAVFRGSHAADSNPNVRFSTATLGPLAPSALLVTLTVPEALIASAHAVVAAHSPAIMHLVVRLPVIQLVFTGLLALPVQALLATEALKARSRGGRAAVLCMLTGHLALAITGAVCFLGLATTGANPGPERPPVIYPAAAAADDADAPPREQPLLLNYATIMFPNSVIFNGVQGLLWLVYLTL